jgi:hypothetical protein
LGRLLVGISFAIEAPSSAALLTTGLSALTLTLTLLPFALALLSFTWLLALARLLTLALTLSRPFAGRLAFTPLGLAFLTFARLLAAALSWLTVPRLLPFAGLLSLAGLASLLAWLSAWFALAPLAACLGDFLIEGIRECLQPIARPPQRFSLVPKDAFGGAVDLFTKLVDAPIGLPHRLACFARDAGLRQLTRRVERLASALVGGVLHRVVQLAGQ